MFGFSIPTGMIRWCVVPSPRGSPVEPTELLGYVANVFDRLRIEYAVVGAMASSYYGEARFTADVDIVVNLPEQAVPALLQAFPTDQYYVSEDAVRQAIRNRAQFNILRPDSGLKIDVMIPKLSGHDP